MQPTMIRTRACHSILSTGLFCTALLLCTLRGCGAALPPCTVSTVDQCPLNSHCVETSSGTRMCVCGVPSYENTTTMPVSRCDMPDNITFVVSSSMPITPQQRPFLDLQLFDKDAFLVRLRKVISAPFVPANAVIVLETIPTNEGTAVVTTASHMLWERWIDLVITVWNESRWAGGRLMRDELFVVNVFKGNPLPNADPSAYLQNQPDTHVPAKTLGWISVLLSSLVGVAVVLSVFDAVTSSYVSETRTRRGRGVCYQLQERQRRRTTATYEQETNGHWSDRVAGSGVVHWLPGLWIQLHFIVVLGLLGGPESNDTFNMAHWFKVRSFARRMAWVGLHFELPWEFYGGHHPARSESVFGTLSSLDDTSYTSIGFKHYPISPEDAFDILISTLFYTAIALIMAFLCRVACGAVMKYRSSRNVRHKGNLKAESISLGGVNLDASPNHYYANDPLDDLNMSTGFTSTITAMDKPIPRPLADSLSHARWEVSLFLLLLPSLCLVTGTGFMQDAKEETQVIASIILVVIAFAFALLLYVTYKLIVTGMGRPSSRSDQTPSLIFHHYRRYKNHKRIPVGPPITATAIHPSPLAHAGRQAVSPPQQLEAETSSCQSLTGAGSAHANSSQAFGISHASATSRLPVVHPTDPTRGVAISHPLTRCSSQERIILSRLGTTLGQFLISRGRWIILEPQSESLPQASHGVNIMMPISESRLTSGWLQWSPRSLYAGVAAPAIGHLRPHRSAAGEHRFVIFAMVSTWIAVCLTGMSICVPSPKGQALMLLIVQLLHVSVGITTPYANPAHCFIEVVATITRAIASIALVVLTFHHANDDRSSVPYWLDMMLISSIVGAVVYVLGLILVAVTHLATTLTLPGSSSCTDSDVPSGHHNDHQSESFTGKQAWVDRDVGDEIFVGRITPGRGRSKARAEVAMGSMDTFGVHDDGTSSALPPNLPTSRTHTSNVFASPATTDGPLPKKVLFSDRVDETRSRDDPQVSSQVRLGGPSVVSLHQLWQRRAALESKANTEWTSLVRPGKGSVRGMPDAESALQGTPSMRAVSESVGTLLSTVEGGPSMPMIETRPTRHTTTGSDRAFDDGVGISSPVVCAMRPLDSDELAASQIMTISGTADDHDDDTKVAANVNVNLNRLTNRDDGDGGGGDDGDDDDGDDALEAHLAEGVGCLASWFDATPSAYQQVDQQVEDTTIDANNNVVSAPHDITTDATGIVAAHGRVIVDYGVVSLVHHRSDAVTDADYITSIDDNSNNAELYLC